MGKVIGEFFGKWFNTNNFYEAVGILEKYWNDDYGTFDIEGKDGITTLPPRLNVSCIIFANSLI